MDADPEVTIAAFTPTGTPARAVAQPDRSWVTRVPVSWPAVGSSGAGVADAAFAAIRESFLAAPPAVEAVHPLRVDRDGDTAVLVFRWRSDPRRFGVRVDLPTSLQEIDDGPGQGAVIRYGPAGWADGLRDWLDEEMHTGGMRGRNHREGDLVVVALGDPGSGVVDRGYYLSRGAWGRGVDRSRRIDQESVPPVGWVKKAGFPTAEVLTAGRNGSLVSWVLAWVNDISGGPLVGQAVCVASGPAGATSAKLVALDVAPAHSGHGLAERLLAHVLGDAADAGITVLDGITAAPPGSGWSTDPNQTARIRLDT